jgi:phosphatidylserine decarboxylase
MPEEIITTTPKPRLPGLDAAATPVIGVGLGLTGIMLGLKPRLAAWPLALTAAAALLYRDPKRRTPSEPDFVFAPADGSVVALEEFYEHRFLHTDAVRLAIAVAPFDVPVQRSPVAGLVAFVEHVPGEYRPVWDLAASEHNERLHIGIKSSWGPVLITLIAGPLGRRIEYSVAEGDHVVAGERLATARFGARVDLVLPADVLESLPIIGDTLRAGVTRVGRVAS